MSRKRHDRFWIHKKWEKIRIDFVFAKHLSYTRFKQICRTMIRDLTIFRLRMRRNLALVLSARFSLSSFRRRINHSWSCSKEGAEPVVPDLIDFFATALLLIRISRGAPWLQEEFFDARNTGIKLINWLRSGYRVQEE